MEARGSGGRAFAIGLGPSKPERSERTRIADALERIAGALDTLAKGARVTQPTKRAAAHGGRSPDPKAAVEAALRIGQPTALDDARAERALRRLDERRGR